MDGPGRYEPLFARLAELAEADPGREVCGFVVADAGGGLSVVPLPNVAARPREAFAIDPAGHLALSRRLREEGGRVAAIFHSHVEGPARLSAEDLRDALVDGQPAMPGTDQIVVGLRRGIAKEIKVFAWRSGAFVEAGGMSHRAVRNAPGAKSRPS
jgi:proteasome lid subunit RPN8/RPN11